MYRLIVTDYDGTLVPKGKELSDKFFTKLNMLASRGILFAVASGRPYNNLKKLFFRASQQMIFVANDGSQVMYKNCVLYKKTVDSENAKKMCLAAKKLNCTPLCALREENVSVKEIQYELPAFLSKDIFKIIIVKNGQNVQGLKDLAPQLNLRACYEDETYLEFCHKDANKGEAVKAVMQKFSVKEKEMLVIGDGANDVPMLLLTNNSYAPENASRSAHLAAAKVLEKDTEGFILGIK